MKILCLIPVYLLVLINAGQQPIDEVSDYSRSFDEKFREEQKITAASTVPCTIEKDIFYSSSGTFYTTVKLGNCNTELKAELISSLSVTIFNQCVIKPSYVREDNYGIRVWNPFLSQSEVIGPLVSNYINWGCNFPVSGLTYMNYNETIYGPQIRNNQLGFAFSEDPDFPSFFESLINSGIIGNPTLCLAVKSSCNFNSEEEAAGKLLIGKSIPEVFPKSYVKFGRIYWDLEWSLQVIAVSIGDEDIFVPNIDIDIDTSTPYIVMDKGSYTSFLNNLQSDFGIECLEEGPKNERGIKVCYVDCAIASKLPRIGLTLSSVIGAVHTAKYFLENNLVTFGGKDGNDQCSLAITGRTLSNSFWRLGTSFFNGRTVCFESASDGDAVYIGSSGL